MALRKQPKPKRRHRFKPGVDDAPRFIKSPRCKVCCAPDKITAAITQDLLNGIGAPSIVAKYQEHFHAMGGLSACNLYNHKHHCDPVQAALKTYANRRQGDAEKLTKSIFAMAHDKAFELLTLIDAGYREMLKDLAALESFLQECENTKRMDEEDVREKFLKVMGQKTDLMDKLMSHALAHLRIQEKIPSQATINVTVLQGGSREFVSDFVKIVTEEVKDPEERKRIAERVMASFDLYIGILAPASLQGAQRGLPSQTGEVPQLEHSHRR